MGANSVSLVPDLFLVCYESHFMMFLSDDKQSYLIVYVALESMCKYLDGIFKVKRKQ